MKKLISAVLAAALCLCLFSGCGKQNTDGYKYSLNTFTASIWGGAELEDVTVDEDSCSLIFDAKDKEIEFSCDGNTFKGALTEQKSQEGADMWKVIWEDEPEGNETYEFSYSAFICNSDYDEASPFVFLLFYFDGEKDSIEVTFSMKNAE